MTAPSKRPPKDGQEATATVELSILLPVYMLLFVGLLTIGHLVLIRQKIVEAVRFQAWLPDEPKTQNNQQVTDNFFATFQQSMNLNGPGYTQLAKTTEQSSPFTFDDSGLFQGCYDATSPSQSAKQLAIDVLNDNPVNGGRRHLWLSHVEGKFTYNPDWMQAFIRAAVTEPKSMCSVLIRVTVAQGGQLAERKSLRYEGANHPWQVTDHNPIEDYVRGDPSFPISIESNGAHDRFFTPGAPDDTVTEQGMTLTPGISPDAGSPNPGIWNQNFRLGGDVNSERGIFYRMLYGG